MLTKRFDEAFAFAHDLHRRQTRKAVGTPYIAHLMSVAALVVEHGGDGFLRGGLQDDREQA